MWVLRPCVRCDQAMAWFGDWLPTLATVKPWMRHRVVHGYEWCMAEEVGPQAVGELCIRTSFAGDRINLLAGFRIAAFGNLSSHMRLWVIARMDALFADCWSALDTPAGPSRGIGPPGGADDGAVDAGVISISSESDGVQDDNDKTTIVDDESDGVQEFRSSGRCMVSPRSPATSPSLPPTPTTPPQSPTSLTPPSEM